MADLLVVVFLGFASFGSPCTLGGPTLGGLGDRLLRLGDDVESAGTHTPTRRR